MFKMSILHDDQGLNSLESDTEPAKMPNKYQSVTQFRGIKVDSGQYSLH